MNASPGTNGHVLVHGTSASMRGVIEFSDRIAPSEASVLITGESGTGKEVLARYIHEHSRRKQGPFVAVNCTAIPDTLFEAELFGYARGAFTGAVRERKGRFEAAERGTVFLDEIGDLTPYSQAKLLRVLQEREITPLGSNQSRPVNVRVISATHHRLEQDIQDKRFRDDLYYRINTILVHLPPLRERSEDIPSLAEHFAKKYGKRETRPIDRIDASALAALQRYSFPGNVRELENMMERAVVLSSSTIITAKELTQATHSYTAEGNARFGKGNVMDSIRYLFVHEALRPPQRYWEWSRGHYLTIEKDTDSMELMQRASLWPISLATRSWHPLLIKDSQTSRADR